LERHRHPQRSPPAAAGADVGATLVKLALRDARGVTATLALPAEAIDEVAERIREVAPGRVGLTGGGAPRLAERVAQPTITVGEFEAWAAGARALLEEDLPPAERFLLVSMGTGTSIMLVEPEGVSRVGGTALGGGTVVGLGAAMLGERDFEAIAALARDGDRRRVDLLVSDIYPDGDSPLPGDVNAASFGKLARPGAPPVDRRDLAHAIMALVGENVGLLCSGLASRHGVAHIVFGGSTLRGNARLAEIVGGLCRVLGHQPLFPSEGQYAGALGALALGSAMAESAPTR
jgi:type II pantothenate kinase